MCQHWGAITNNYHPRDDNVDDDDDDHIIDHFGQEDHNYDDHHFDVNDYIEHLRFVFEMLLENYLQ